MNIWIHGWNCNGWKTSTGTDALAKLPLFSTFEHFTSQALHYLHVFQPRKLTMPSKANKKKAAAERSAALKTEEATVQANAPSTPVSAALPVPTKAETPVTSAPIQTKPAETPKASAPIPVEISEYGQVALLKRLSSTTKPERVTTNSFQMKIDDKKVYRYLVTITKKFTTMAGVKKTVELAGAEGSDRHRQTIFFNLVKDFLASHPRAPKHWAYDGAATLYSVDKFSELNFHRESEGEWRDKNAFFSRGKEGSLTVSISLNNKEPVLSMKDILQEDLSAQTSCPTRQMLQIALIQEARKRGMAVVDNGKQIFGQGTPAPNERWVIEKNGVGAGVKIVEGEKNAGAAHVVLDFKRTRFFATVPLHDVRLDFADRAKASQYIKGLKANTVYSTQLVRMDGFSQLNLRDIKVPERGDLLTSAATLAGRREDQYSLNRPVVESTSYNKKQSKMITYSFPMENLVLAPNQKLGPKHGNPPECVAVHKRYGETLTVGAATGLLADNDTLKAFGVSIQRTPLSIDAVNVPIPDIQYQGMMVKPNSGKWSIGRAKLIVPKNIQQILVLYNSSALSKHYDISKVIGRLVDKLHSMGALLGMRITRITPEDLYTTYRKSSVCEAIDKKMDSLSKVKDVMVIYADESTQPTHGILKLKERQSGVVTQRLCLDKSLLLKQSRDRQADIGASTITNILFKLNVKAGGWNHRVTHTQDDIKKFWGQTSKTLFISYDVCHSSGAKSYCKGETSEEPSTVGFAYNGTLDPEVIIGDFHYQLPRNEEVDEAILRQRAGMMLNHYVDSRKTFPENIVILRDGVSEGQHKMVVDKEFTAIKQGIQTALKNIYNNKPFSMPKFALSIVTKRHAHRLFKNDTKIENVKSMIAIDSGIVKKSANELIFVSHCPLKGTAQPILVNTLINESVFSNNNQLVNVLAALSCAHQKSTTIVSLPETVYAADEYAKRGADIFETYKMWHKGTLPTIEDNDGVVQYNWSLITRDLCYHQSAFKNRRIV
uniref:Piwi domain-containing protein n=1 Tax=Caenorhabditis tropicalis TaxID=1561998 RepID=A0A1I7TES2_9PELO